MNGVTRLAALGSRRGLLGVSAPRTLGAHPLLTRRYGYDSKQKAAPEPLRKTGVELWSEKQAPGQEASPIPEQDADELFSHPLYTPPARPQTGIGPVQAPLKWPEWDQSLPSHQASGLPSPPTYYDAGFDDPATAPIGDYPHVKPQFALLRNPFGYWDQQGRRDYGEILYDHDQFTDIWSIGPEVHWWEPFKHAAQVLAAIAGMGVLVHWWDPAEHLWFAEKDYPYDGLRVELGGDPNDESDITTRANIYKI
ncbi:uncharacterized protein EV422DRAFT_529901 [Fimicolochytrium jonesii]|uniref:uncharacterized protein n=1 Tax=Fimicolochytrium jonesii TaxID=1396493 RepID=UPI0022FEE143|nr:uncharacterized protein EV422DRAFT_529901 [Fimicolochytrium jonesii]KAI8820726.1 hypothetical protein EV422DRAFT_529901 [Fimicolochytrium jonesii]